MLTTALSQVSVGGDLLTAGGDLTVTKQYVAAEVSWPVRVGAIPALADCYQPRRESQRLRDAVGVGGTAVLTQVLSGLGGVGKSQLAAAYAWSVAGEVDVLVWVSATTRAAVLSAYTQASIQLGLATDAEHTQAAARFLSWLQTTDRAWVVVLDDLADPADLRGLWPDPARGRTLVTTRRADPSLITQSRRRVEVGLFSPGEARDYLAAKLAGTNLSQADELAAAVGYLPLALAQAASFILNQGQTCAEYRARLLDRRTRLARVFPEDAPADEYRATVGATWSISVEAADRLHPRGVAAPLLRVLSMLDPNGVPADILTSDALTGLLTATGVAADPDAVAVSGRDCQDAAHNLARLSLLTLSHPTGTEGGGFARIRVHALVQRAATEHLTPEQIAPLVTAAADALEGIWPKVERDPQLGQILRANTTALAVRHPNALWVPDRHPLLERAGKSLGESGLVTAAIDYWTQLATAATEHLGPDHPDTLTTCGNLAY